MIRLTSPPIDDKANKELVISSPKSSRYANRMFLLQRGERSRDKTLLIKGVSREMAEQSLLD